MAKNKMHDVRDHLILAMERLNYPENGDAPNFKILEECERAKAVATLAGKYIDSVKVEVVAVKLIKDTGRIPAFFNGDKQITDHKD